MYRNNIWYVMIMMFVTTMLLYTPVNAKEPSKDQQSGDSSISYTIDSNSYYELDVVVLGSGGYVIDGHSKITDGEVIYNLRLDQHKFFHVQANEGYLIQSVTLEEPEFHKHEVLASKVDKVDIDLPIESTKMILYVEAMQLTPIEPIEPIKPIEPVTPNTHTDQTADTGTHNGNEIASTADVYHIEYVYGFYILCILICSYIISRRNE